jgi:hypothetical protein
MHTDLIIHKSALGNLLGLSGPLSLPAVSQYRAITDHNLKDTPRALQIPQTPQHHPLYQTPHFTPSRRPSPKVFKLNVKCFTTQMGPAESSAARRKKRRKRRILVIERPLHTAGPISPLLARILGRPVKHWGLLLVARRLAMRQPAYD